MTALSHPWTVDPQEAVAIQRRLAAHVVCNDRFGDIRTVAGVDVAYDRANGLARAAAVVYRFAGGEALGEDAIDQAVVTMPVTFPYIPGLLTFREAPAAVAAIEALRVEPDLLLCDGQGIAHPRRLGLASHLGLFLDLPSIGVAKTRLVGTVEEPGGVVGSWRPLFDRGEIIGAALRTRKRVRPLYVSTGHRVSLPTVIRVVLQCGIGFRLPEPCRQADILSKFPRS